MGCFSCITNRATKGSTSEYDDEELRSSFSPSVPIFSERAISAALCLDDNETMADLINSNAASKFTLRELAVATENFSDANFKGHARFGKANYKGSLQNGQVIAVQDLNSSYSEARQEFVVAVVLLSKLHHPNLVSLIGYCVEQDRRLLVYEFMPKISLADHLFDDKYVLQWSKRLQIASGVARGLQYLHCKAKPPVIYFRSLTSSEILLDSELNPKLSEFGLAKVGPNVSLKALRASRYNPPEISVAGRLSFEHDIYNFGILLLEIVAGRKAWDTDRRPGEESIVSWARPLLCDPQRYIELVDPRLAGQFPAARSVRHLLAVTAMCLQEDPNNRPTVEKLVTKLEFITSQCES